MGRLAFIECMLVWLGVAVECRGVEEFEKDKEAEDDGPTDAGADARRTDFDSGVVVAGVGIFATGSSTASTAIPGGEVGEAMSSLATLDRRSIALNSAKALATSLSTSSTSSNDSTVVFGIGSEESMM